MNRKRKKAKREERIMVPLSAQEKAQLEARAAADGVSMSHIVRTALASYLK